jgi:hypothetical protein
VPRLKKIHKTSSTRPYRRRAFSTGYCCTKAHGRAEDASQVCPRPEVRLGQLSVSIPRFRLNL